jgi:hypothetical protein
MKPVVRCRWLVVRGFQAYESFDAAGSRCARRLRRGRREKGKGQKRGVRKRKSVVGSGRIWSRKIELFAENSEWEA